MQTGSYANRHASEEYQEYSWNHSISETVNALIKHGLKIEHLNEFPFSCYNCFNNLLQGDDGYWRIERLENKIPLMYSIRSVKVH
jgi:hypothetical protein